MTSFDAVITDAGVDNVEYPLADAVRDEERFCWLLHSHQVVVIGKGRSSGETVVGAESMRPISITWQDLQVCDWDFYRYQRTATPGARITGVTFRDGPAVWVTE